MNLGQGFPDWESPRFVKDALIRATNENHNQYARSAGHPPLVQAIAKRYSKALGRELDWENEITVGVGSSESLYAIMMALVEPEDEVIMISPGELRGAAAASAAINAGLLLLSYAVIVAEAAEQGLWLITAVVDSPVFPLVLMLQPSTSTARRC